ncbi:hypothetical protein O181_027947 [Austropuccinia psidii MF-1]|uniref:Uncharacterized protein n=1 Tax=Austropuccinia psidii MF-1 TaxID=1389203 RepID=A0A9Q3H255_9BASI|nr:hypothetical protein [Austropuccinia psidii MF-1]
MGDHQITGETLKAPRNINKYTSIPSLRTHLQRKMGAPSHGSLKASEWFLVFKEYITFLFLSEEISSAHQPYPTSSRMIRNEIFKNSFNLINAVNIYKSWTISKDDMNSFSKYWKKFCLSDQKPFPNQSRKPNNHYAEHIPELLSQWGPAQALATWGYECFIGALG